MSGALTAACLWVVVAALAAMMPRRFHWTAAHLLTVSGIALLGWVTWSEGPIWGFVCLLAGASVLRWPLLRLARRIRG